MGHTCSQSMGKIDTSGWWGTVWLVAHIVRSTRVHRQGNRLGSTHGGSLIVHCDGNKVKAS